MHIEQNVDLSSHSTMRLGGKARYLAEVRSDQDIVELISFAREKSVDFLMIGEGSNIVWKDEGYPGLIMVNKIIGREVLEEDESGATVRLGSGENWDKAVVWTLEHGFGGLEFLSKIPGTVGAAPVQNIGAYGAEISDVLVEVQAYDAKTGSFGSLSNDACHFGYRTSRFKKADKGRFLITGLTLKLHKNQPQPPFYESLDDYLNQHEMANPTREKIREAVVAIRSVKLPDPSVVANNGSFFTNPIVEQSKVDELKHIYPEIKSWPMPDGRVKLSAGWLVEKAGFKNIHDEQTGMATWHGSSLVLVNEKASSTADLLTFKQGITAKVQELFGVALEQEPELLP